MAEMKAGYKDTDIGVIPEDWDVESLGNVSHISMGQSPLSKFYNTSGVGLPLVQGNADIKNRKTIIRQYSSQTTKLGKQGDIILTVRAPVGAVAKATFDCCLGRGVCSIRYPNDYLFYFLQKLENGWAKYTAGSTFDSINSEHVKKVMIPVPKPEEQKQIAAALSDVDGLIESLERLIAKKRDMKTAAMQQLLTGKKRLPGFDGEWAEKRVDEFGYFKSGNGFPTKYQGRQKGEYGFFKVSDMNNTGNSTHMHVANNYISNSVAKILGANIIPERSIVFAKIGAAIFLERKKVTVSECCIDNNMMAFILDHKISDYIFFHYLFLHLEFRKLVAATALPSLSPKDIGSLSLFLPKKEEQTAIASILSDMDTEIDALEQRLAKARSLKTGMMQELLTGRTRFIKTDKKQEAV